MEMRKKFFARQTPRSAWATERLVVARRECG
jgi:hypothetical protein